MKILPIIIALLLLSSLAHSEVYKWQDEKGGMHFTDNPLSVPEKYREKVYDQTRSEIQSRAPQVSTQVITQIPQNPTIVYPSVNQNIVNQANIERQQQFQEALKLQRDRAAEQSKQSLQAATRSVMRFTLFCIIGGSLVTVIKNNKSGSRRSKASSQTWGKGGNSPPYPQEHSRFKVISQKPTIDHEIIAPTVEVINQVHKTESRNTIRESVKNESKPIHSYDPYIPLHVHETTSKPQIPTWNDPILSIIEWKRFEIVCLEFFKMKGFNALETRVGADGGVDINLYFEGLETPAAVVQCKAWNAYKVGVKPIRELYGVMAADQVEEGFFVTSGEFTKDAFEFAEGKKLHLMTGDRLVGKIRKLPQEQQDQLLKVALEGDYSTPTCPQCDVKMTVREGKVGRNAGKQFWGCVNYPKCSQRFNKNDRKLYGK